MTSQSDSLSWRAFLDQHSKLLNDVWMFSRRRKFGPLETERRALGITQSRLAEKLYVSRQSVERLLQRTSSRNVSMATLERAADALGCHVAIVLVPKDGKTFEELWSEQLPLGSPSAEPGVLK